MGIFSKTTVESIEAPFKGIVKNLKKHADQHHWWADHHERIVATNTLRQEANKANSRAEHYTKLFNL